MSFTLTHAPLRTCCKISGRAQSGIWTARFRVSLSYGNEHRESTGNRDPVQRMISTTGQQMERDCKDVAGPSSSHFDGHRIYILGVGNIGKLFAHAIVIKSAPPPLTLLLHRSSHLKRWEEAGKTIEIITDGVGVMGGVFDVEVVQAISEDGSGQEAKIENLIVATKAPNTAAAINSIKNRLTKSSNILFTQNGMGIIEEVSSKVFPDPALRPRYLACVTSHGIYSQGPFSSVHAGFGTVAISTIPQQARRRESYHQLETNNPAYLVQEIVGAPLLAAREVSPVELARLQLEKLVVNAMINPLTVIFNRRNGELFTNPKIKRFMRILLAEVSQVICSLPELQDDPTTLDRFSEIKLDTLVHDIANKTAKNTSSMLQDVRAGRQTEIDYINGYLVRRGFEIGVECNNNERLVQLVKQARVFSENEIDLLFPDET